MKNMKAKIVKESLNDIIKIQMPYGKEIFFNSIPMCHSYEIKSIQKGIIFGVFTSCGDRMNHWKSYNEYVAINQKTMEVIGVFNPGYSNCFNYKSFREEMKKIINI